MRSARAPLALLLLAGGLALLTSLWTARPARAQILTPGPLAKAHLKLEGDTHCTDCHQGGKRVVAERCLDCHKELAARVSAKKGLHGTGYLGQDCGPCHVDHLGVDARLVHWPGGDQAKFDHALTGWKLTGKHAGVECAKCHDKKLSGGEATFLLLSEACATCHEDVHKGRFGKSCERCHNTEDFKRFEESTFDHSKTRFPLLGAHAKVACKQCHGEPPKWTGLAFESCEDCHKDPHQGRFKPTPCSSCHTEKSWKSTSIGRNNHPGTSLANGHLKVACKTCHDKGNDRPPSKGTKCVSCHPVIHKAAFGDDCKKCHADILWLGIPREVSLEAHQATVYPLQGKHAEVGCDSCHSPKKKEDDRFRRLKFGRCIDCHADKHKGEFASHAQGECAPCHAVEGFAPTLFGVPQHSHTRFALEGRHRAVPCSGCHPGPAPRLDWKNPKLNCADCHANPHGHQFDAEMAQGGCAHCHNVEGWGQVKVDHSIFPLLGAHARAACSACHDPTPEDKLAGKGASWRGLPHECEGCHADEHGGQFRSAPAKGCNSCHDNDAFQLPNFDHATMTGWPLEGKHVGLECDKCHKQERRKDGVMSVRYRLGYHACRDCHADPHKE